MKKNNDTLYKILRPIFTFLFKVYYNPTVVGKENIPLEGSGVLAGNHKHALDPIFVDIGTKRVVHSLAKKSLHDSPVGWFFKSVGTIPVDLHAARNKEALDAAVDYLKQGCLVYVAPEAKRNYTEEILLPFKVGAVVMAMRSDSRITPFAITGDYKFRSKNLKITFGEPIDVSGMDVPEANQLLFDTIKKMLIQDLGIE